jgi:citrate lyase alpha subunit
VDVVETVTAPQYTVPAVITLSGMSVTELKALLKEKYKNQPEKYAEIQKLKKAELINALQQIQ